ncbi:MAG: hypothetical protein AAGB18_06755 [Pseudomonadota bacterium]
MPKHYYYFPFNPDPTGSDDAQKLTEKTVLAKYQHGRGTVGFTRPKGSDITTPYPRTNKAKHYATQDNVKLTCTYWKSVKELEERDGWGHKKTERSFVGRQTRPLRVVQPGDILMVDGHCNQRSNAYCNFRASFLPGAVELTPDELADILIKEGLEDGVVIKLLGCYSAGGPTSNPIGPEDAIFARKLAMLLKKYKPGTVVSGYPGTVSVGSVTQGGVTVPQPLMVTMQTSAEKGKHVIRYYDTDGNLLKKTRGPNPTYEFDPLVNQITIGAE